MSNFLDQFKGKPAASAKSKSAVSVYSVGPIAQPVQQRAAAGNGALPRAAAIYGAAAAVFAVLTVFYLIKGIWFTGLVMIIPTICLGGFAYYNLKE